jgi:hypothetical protein
MTCEFSLGMDEVGTYFQVPSHNFSYGSEENSRKISVNIQTPWRVLKLILPESQTEMPTTRSRYAKVEIRTAVPMYDVHHTDNL